MLPLPWLFSTFAMLLASVESVSLSQNFSIDLSAATTYFHHAWEECVGSGHASLTLRSDWRAQLTRCRKDLGFKRTRFHGLLDDDMSISLKEGVNSYVNLDSIIDFHASIGMVPLFELSFMPEWLSSKPTTTCHYKGITSPPKNYTKWGNMIQEMATHLLARYGRETCETFIFEVWNEPNGGNNPDAGFWTGWPKQETYFRLYKETADAFSRVSDAFKVGGPATAGCGGWIGDLQHFVANQTPPTKLDFISCHSYGGGNNNSDVGDIGFIDSFIASKKQAKGLPLIVTEWSSSWSYNVDFHDEPGSAAFLIAAIKKADGATDMMSYWTFSDVFEEGGILPSAFHGGFGLLTVYGTPKPAFRAFQLLHEAGEERLAVNAAAITSSGGETCTDGGVLATVANGTLNLFLYNHLVSGLTGSTCTLTVTLKGPHAQVPSSFVTRIDQRNANPKAAFLAMGSPDSPSKEQIQQLESASELVWKPLPESEGVSIHGTSEISVEVPPHGLCVLRVPLSGQPIALHRGSNLISM